VVAPLAPAAIHPLTPGTPLYGMLKIGAIGALVGLRFVMARRSREHQAETQPEPVEVAPPVAQPHPVSKKKKRRKRRG
jgi:hypothetical protein